MQRRTSSDELSDVGSFIPLDRSNGNVRTLAGRKATVKNENLSEKNVEGLYEVNTANWEKTMTPGNAEESTAKTINWSSFFPAVAGQKAAANPPMPPGKPFGTLPTRPYGNSPTFEPLPISMYENSPPTIGGPTTVGRPTITVGGRRTMKNRKARKSSKKSRSKKSKKSKKSRNTRKYRR